MLNRSGNRKGMRHGKRYDSIYNIYRNMKQKCLNENHPRYSDYGGRGIKICQHWLASFENFYADMGDRPSGLSLDRKDNNKGYSKENCRWATPREQNLNQRQHKPFSTKGIELEAYGFRGYVSEWAKIMEIPKDRIWLRIRKGHSVYNSVFMPKRRN